MKTKFVLGTLMLLFGSRASADVTQTYNLARDHKVLFIAREPTFVCWSGAHPPRVGFVLTISRSDDGKYGGNKYGNSVADGGYSDNFQDIKITPEDGKPLRILIAGVAPDADTVWGVLRSEIKDEFEELKIPRANCVGNSPDFQASEICEFRGTFTEISTYLNGNHAGEVYQTTSPIECKRGGF